MDLERAMEAQRVKLLRLLTGWLAAVVLVSGVSLDLPLPRWVRGFITDLIVRAELAAAYLVRVSAYVQAGDQWIVVGDSSPVLSRISERCDEPPTTAALVRRIKALRRLLQDLPRHGRRLLRPLDGGEVEADCAGGFRAVDCGLENSAHAQWIAPGIERPPDTSQSFRFLDLRSRSDRTGGLGVTGLNHALRLTA